MRASKMKLATEVPTHFFLGGHRIRVIVDANSDHEKAGVWIPEENEIRLYPKGRNYEYMVQVFYHELTHAILDVWSRPKDSSNEKLVDAIGQGLLQFAQTARYAK